MHSSTPSGSDAPVLLLGADHNELGDITVVEVAPQLAVGISRGRFPKGYPHIDPNEDAALAATDGRTTILAIADGHHGIEASHAAIRGIAEAYRPGDDRSITDTVVTLAASAIRAVAEAVADLGAPRNASRTSLTVAVVGAGAIAATTIGDTACFVATRRRATRIGAVSGFLSPITNPDDVVVDTAALPARGAVIVTSDGVLDFVADEEQSVRTVAGLRSAAGVELLIAAAFNGGAGDNTSVAVHRWPKPTQRR